MSQEQLNFIFILLTLLIVWSVALTLFILRATTRYKKLTQSTGGQNLEQIVEKLLRRQEVSAGQIASLSSDFVNFQKKSTVFFQKASLLRFNPFEDSGGDQSFVVALLDGADNGFILSSLHSRSGTRVYAKDIKSGKSATHALTKEEKEALEKALRRK